MNSEKGRDIAQPEALRDDDLRGFLFVLCILDIGLHPVFLVLGEDIGKLVPF